MAAVLDSLSNTNNILCPSMRLTRPEPKAFELNGPGEIWRDAEGQIQFKMFVEGGADRLVEDLHASITPGEAIPKAELFGLAATDLSGERWTSAHILPTVSVDPNGRGVVGGLLNTVRIRQDFTDLYSRSNVSVPRRLEIRIHGHIEFPSNTATKVKTWRGGTETMSTISLNAVVVNGHDYRLEMYPEGDHTVAALSEFEDEFDAVSMHLEEALQFALGQSIRRLSTKFYEGHFEATEHFSLTRDAGVLPAPFSLRRLDSSRPVWEIFERYFEFVRESGCKEWHPLSMQLGSILETTGKSISAQVLSLAVAVEGVATECYLDMAETPKETRDSIDSVLKVVKTLEGIDKDARGRIEGSLRSMQNPRGSDAIRAFVSGSQNLGPNVFKSWRALRNTSAHGKGVTEIDIPTLVLQQNQVLHLFYEMVLDRIGYQGPRTHYSKPQLAYEVGKEM